MSTSNESRRMSLIERVQYAISVWNPRFMFDAHVAMYRLTGGFVGGKLRGMPVLLLTTSGRKTGKEYIKPLVYLRDDETFVVVAANAGQDKPPHWFLNLQNNPQTTIQVGRIRYKVIANTANPEERERLWPRLVALNPFYAEFTKRTTRQLPVVVIRVTQ